MMVKFLLPPDLDAFVHRMVSAGTYESEEAVIIAGLHLLQERKRDLEAIRGELLPALEELDRGEGISLDFEEIKTRGR